MAIDMKNLAFTSEDVNKPIDNNNNLNPNEDTLIVPDSTDTSDSLETTGEISTTDELPYIIGADGNLFVQRDGKDFLIAKKEEFSFNEETGEVGLNEDVNVDHIILNKIVQERLEPVLSLLPVEERSLFFNGSAESLIDIVTKVGQAQTLATIEDLGKENPIASDLILHLIGGGTVDQFLSRNNNDRIDFGSISETPSADQTKSVVLHFLTNVAHVKDPESIYTALRDTEQLSDYYKTAKESLIKFYQEQDQLKVEKASIQQSKELADRKAYWGKVESKINTLDLNGFKLEASDATNFYKFLAEPKNGETEEAKFSKVMTDEHFLVEKYLRYAVSTGKVTLADFNKLLVKATSDTTRRTVKAIITKQTTAPPTQRINTGNGGVEVKADVSKLVF